MRRGTTDVSAAERERLKMQARAEIEWRQRENRWSAGVQPHWAYQTRPLEWITKYLEIPEETLRWSLNPEYANHSWDGDRDPLIQVLDGLANWDDVCVESATGTGKTFLAACVTYWFQGCFENSYVITAAPRELQLLEQLWKEMGALWPRFEKHFPEARLLSGKLRMKPSNEGKETWAAMAFVSGVGADEEAAQRAAGFHREHMLIITEETPGIHNAIMNAFQHTRTDDHNLHLALGNPDNRNDPLHQFGYNEKNEPRDGVVNIRISAYDHPNIVCKRPIVPGAIGAERLKKRIALFGKGTRLYQSRVRGISPAEAEEALIKWKWCVAAAERYDDKSHREEADGELGLGVDVADAPEGDPFAIARWQGSCLTEVESSPVDDASLLGQRVFLEATDKDRPVDPRYIGVDSVGVGASLVNEMRRCGMKVRHISGGRKAVPGVDQDVLWSTTETELETHIRPTGQRLVEAERFNNLRSQVWWRMRDDLRLGRVALPPDEELWQELCTPTYKTKGSVIIVEAKEEIIKRLRRSPNKADAACYGNFVRKRGKFKKNKPLPTVQEGPNLDTRLEKMMMRHHKHGTEEERKFLRLMHRRAKARKRQKGGIK